MKIVYIPGDSLAFKAFIDSKKAELRGIDGHFRWVITGEGEEYIARPEIAK